VTDKQTDQQTPKPNTGTTAQPERAPVPSEAAPQYAPPADLANATPAADPAEEAMRLSRLAPSLRQNAIGQMQRAHGNFFVQRLVRQLRSQQSTSARPAENQPITSPPRPPAAHGPSPANPDADVVQRAEQALGYDLSSVDIQRDSGLAAASGAEAVTIGRSVHLAPGLPGADTTHGRHVLAHELAHVVQQGEGQTRKMGPARYASLEAQADRHARQVQAARPMAASPTLRPLPAPAAPVRQAFDPRYHRQSLVEGMVGTGFSSEEIGLMYAANWERDFSQAHPALGAVVLAWKSVKLAASQNRLTEAETDAFDGAVNNVIGMVPFRVGELIDGKAYGGYVYYEHMDNPTGDPNMAAETREALLRTPPGESIPQYMVDSREYMKAQLFRAASEYRGDMSESSASGQVAAAWERRQREVEALKERETPGTTSVAATAAAQETAVEAAGTPAPTSATPSETTPAPAPVAVTSGPGGEMMMPADTLQASPPGAATEQPTSGPVFNMEVDRRFWQQTNYKVGQRLDPALPEDAPYVQIWLRIRDQVRTEREAANAAARRAREQSARPPNGARPPGAGNGAAASAAVAEVAAQPPARPGNFSANVADAMGRASHALEDFFSHSNFVEIAIGEVAPQEGLATATFTSADSTHSLAHKIRSAADEIEAEMPLINHILGRTEDELTPEDVNVGNTAPPVHEDEDIEDIWDVVGDAPGGAKIGAAIGAGIGGLLGLIGGPAGAVAGAAGGGLLGGAIGGFFGLRPEVRRAALEVGGRTAGGALLGALGGGVAGFLVGGLPGMVAGGLAGAAYGGIQGLRSGVRGLARNVLATPRGVGLLRRISEMLEESTRASAEPGSHTALAKDQPAHEDDAFGRLKTIKFQLAQELAAAADRRILGAMRQVFDQPTPEAADARLKDIYTDLDAMIAGPGPGHPMAAQIDRRREEAISALEDYRKSQQQ
jgi:hypothetical protein